MGRSRTYPAKFGMRRLGSGSTFAPAVLETVDIGAVHSGNNVIDITTIDGLALTEFTHVLVSFVDATRSSASSDVEIDFRPEGGSFGSVSYLWHEFSSTNFNRQTTDVPITSATSLTVVNGSLWLSSFNQSSPTGWIWNEFHTSASFPSTIRGQTTSGNQVHDALRIRANGGGGGETWSSGTLIIIGYRLPVDAVYSGSVSGSTVDIDLGGRVTMADVFFDNQSVSAAAYTGVQVGTGDVFVSSNYKRWEGDSIACATGGTAGNMYINRDGTATTSRYGWMSVYNLNTSAPVMAMVKDLGNDGTDTNPQEVRHFMTNNTSTKYDQLRLFCAGGQTFTAGTYTVVAYRPRSTVHFFDDLPAANTVEATNLKRNNAGIMCMGSHDAVRNSAAGITTISSGSGGYSGDYDHLRIDESNDVVVAGDSSLWIGDANSRAEGGFFAIVVGLPYAGLTSVISGGGMPMGFTSIDFRVGQSNTAQKEDQVRFQSFSGADPTYASGKGIITGFAG